MVKNNIYFYLSGLISISLFTLFLSFFIIMLFSSTIPKVYALEKKEYISVSIVIPETKAVKNDNKVVKKVLQEKSIVKNDSSVFQENIDVSDLFSDVWTKKISKKTPKKVNQKLINELSKRTDIQNKSTNKVESISKKIDKIEVVDIVENNITLKESASSNEVNEYLAKINFLVYEHFLPPQNSQGHSVKAVIELNTIGKLLDFRILTYSANEALNSECDKLKERLESVVFPINPENISSRTIVILTSKE